MKPIYTFLLALFSVPAFATSALPEPAPNVLFILDASGSMWQKLNGEFKITSAKSVLKNLLGQLPANAKVGMVVYGHTHKSDCNDIETLVPLSLLDKKNFESRLDAINPTGKTPIAKSISHALALVQTESEPVSIVLISDGLETCEGNACDLVRKAKERGVKITVHVVGFGIEEKDQSPLECIAQAGGGQYLSANDASELNDALIKTVEAPPAAGGYLAVKVTQEDKLMDATVKVFKKGVAKEVYAARTYTNERTNPRIMLLPAGEYLVSATSVTMDGRPTQTLSDLRIVENDTLVREVNFAQGTFEVRVTRNGVLSDAGIGIFKKGEKQTTAQGRTYRSSSSNPAQYRVLPGLYDIEIKSIEIAGGPSVRIVDQELSGGTIIPLVHNFESGELTIGATQSGAFVDAAISITQNGKSVTGGRTYTSASSNPKSFTLEPGKYEVKVAPVKPKGLANKTLEIEVKAKEATVRALEW